MEKNGGQLKNNSLRPMNIVLMYFFDNNLEILKEKHPNFVNVIVRLHKNLIDKHEIY